MQLRSEFTSVSGDCGVSPAGCGEGIGGVPGTAQTWSSSLNHTLSLFVHMYDDVALRTAFRLGFVAQCAGPVCDACALEALASH